MGKEILIVHSHRKVHYVRGSLWECAVGPFTSLFPIWVIRLHIVLKMRKPRVGEFK